MGQHCVVQMFHDDWTFYCYMFCVCTVCTRVGYPYYTAKSVIFPFPGVQSEVAGELQQRDFWIDCVHTLNKPTLYSYTFDF